MKLGASKKVFTRDSRITAQFNGDTNYNFNKLEKTVKKLDVKIKGVKNKYKTNERVEIKLDKKIRLTLKLTVIIKNKSYKASFKTNTKGEVNINLYGTFKKKGMGKGDYKIEFWYPNNKNVDVTKLKKTIKIY